ncbi:MAG TPA: hypothetical protein VK477_12880 [Acidobacteriota bacterium]|nr:hypothetical protein [Acidobacteriota bacterium]
MSVATAALTMREVLFAVGFTMLTAGIFLRGFARSTRRSLALRREHGLHVRKIDAPAANPDDLVRTTHLERNVGRYAVACLLLGAGVVVAALFCA